MIRIERQGTKKYVKCDNCGSILSFEKEDEIERVTIRFIYCPGCGERIALAEYKGNDIWQYFKVKDKISDFDKILIRGL